ncbi:ribosome biogenesis GTPase YlqF [Eubacterium xylanophilum]|uniref:ribosome biogenesis GTPase YlqF n=1 Tax=Eubacterium xylanophilum TaxID=39497 RepID=UPI00047D1110|nr:ribosome biogenesis GTPase YlqF [Eubacterium xylanophilum]MCR5796963.1 ribosome biogenesis GTPase YlqF [Eubacterium sp.]
MHFQWYPGHMTKAVRGMREDIKLIDVVIELVDARCPMSSKNPDIDDIAKNKSRILLLNKADMADEKVTAQWKKYYENQGFFVHAVNSTKRNELKIVNSLIQSACKEKIERDRKRGILNRPVRAMIVGIPNVGKSTFINSFSGKACTKTGNKPGVTKGKQWVRINKSVELLDTPGILWPKFEDQTVGLRLAFIGSIKEELLQRVEISLDFIDFVRETYPGTLKEKYSVEEIGEASDILMKIAENRNFVKKGNEIDYEKAAATILDEFRHTKLGRITVERPQES